MLSQLSYPIICTEKFSQTVNFYEDYFSFEPAFEMEEFIILKRTNWPHMYWAVMNAQHKDLPAKFRKPAQGMILNFPVKSADKKYEELYIEGLNILFEPKDALCGRHHFFVEDPNGLLIDVAENIDLEDVMDKDEIQEKIIVPKQ